MPCADCGVNEAKRDNLHREKDTYIDTSSREHQRSKEQKPKKSPAAEKDNSLSTIDDRFQRRNQNERRPPVGREGLDEGTRDREAGEESAVDGVAGVLASVLWGPLPRVSVT